MYSRRLTSISFAVSAYYALVSPVFSGPADLGEIEVRAAQKHESPKAPSSFTTIVKPTRYDAESKTVVEMVSSAPGVQSKELGGPGQYSTVTIRGSSAEQVTILIDGTRVNTASGGGVDFSSIPAESIERIEVIRGGGTAIFGPDAVGGAVNIITKEAKEGREIEIKETGGSFMTFKSSESWRERRKKWGLVLSHTHAQGKGNYSFKSATTDLAGTRIGGGQTFTRTHNGFISEDLLTKFDIAPVSNLKFEISNNFFFTDREIPGLEEETTLLYPANPLEAEETIFRNISGGRVRAAGLFDGHLSLETGISNNLATDRFADPSPAIGTAIDRKTFNDSINPYLLIEPSFSNRVSTHLLTLRYDFRYDLFHDSSHIENAILTGKRTRSSHGIFLQDEISLLKERLSLIPAIRYQDASDFPDDISLKIGAAARPLEYFTIKGNIETSFRYPNFDELYFPDQGYLRGNADLNKEEAVNYDVGAVLEVKFARLEVVYFRNDIKNQIIWVPISAVTIQPINTYDVNAYGIEASSSISPANFLTLDTNYTWLSAHFKSNELQLPGRPRHKVDARLDIHHNFSDFFGGNLFSEIQYVSSLPVNTQNTVFIAGRTTLNLGATTRFSPKKRGLGRYALTFETKDVTNVQVYDARGFPLPRRSFFVTLGVKWS